MNFLAKQKIGFLDFGSYFAYVSFSILEWNIDYQKKGFEHHLFQLRLQIRKFVPV